MKIGTLARRSGLSADTLRYYERIGLLPRADRDAGGRRDYGASDLLWVEFLQKLQATAMPIRKRLEYTKLRAGGPGTAAARRAILEGHAADLVRRRGEIDACLALLGEKITLYRKMEAGEI
jgi:DNA-binding transcriptional MerR regulator